MNRFVPGKPLPTMHLATVQGQEITLGKGSNWTMLVVYRGRHCSRCKPYLNKLDGLTSQLNDLGVQVIAVSADPLERAQADFDEFGWRFPLAYGLTLEAMRELCLYLSDSMKETEPGYTYAEPGLFVTNADGLVQIVSISNAPSTRPDLDLVADGIAAIQRKGLAIRGKAV